MITPQLTLELRAPSRVAGFIGGETLFWIDIPVDIFERICELVVTGVPTPTWYDLSKHNVAERRIIATTNPEWFITFEEQTRHAQQQG